MRGILVCKDDTATASYAIGPILQDYPLGYCLRLRGNVSDGSKCWIIAQVADLYDCLDHESAQKYNRTAAQTIMDTYCADVLIAPLDDTGNVESMADPRQLPF